MSRGKIKSDTYKQEIKKKKNFFFVRFPDIVHNGTRPAQLCYAGNAEYQKQWREFVKYR